MILQLLSKRFNVKNPVFLLLFVFSLFSNAYPQENLVDGIAAIVGDKIVLKSDVLQVVQMSVMEQKLDPVLDNDKILSLQERILGGLIEQKIVLEIAEVESIEVSERDVDAALEQHINSIIARAGSEERMEELIGKKVKQLKREFWPDIRDQLIMERFKGSLLKDITITKDEVENFYYQYKDSLGSLPTLYNLSHILFKIKPGEKSKNEVYKKIKKIRERIIQGEDFAVLAKEYSHDPGSARYGGDLGFVGRGTFVPSFEQVSFSLEENELSDIVETPFGYHIIQLIKKVGDKVNVRHILIVPQPSNEDLDKLYSFISSVRDSIIKNDNFEEFVLKYSEDEFSKEAGGSLGWINPQSFPIAEIPKVLPALKVKEISPPIKASDGYHLLLINGIKIGGNPTLENHWAEIERFALMYKKNTYFAKWMDNAGKRVFVRNYMDEKKYKELDKN